MISSKQEIEKERMSFETRANRLGIVSNFTRNEDGFYTGGGVEDLWRGWAMAEGIENLGEYPPEPSPYETISSRVISTESPGGIMIPTGYLQPGMAVTVTYQAPEPDGDMCECCLPQPEPPHMQTVATKQEFTEADKAAMGEMVDVLMCPMCRWGNCPKPGSPAEAGTTDSRHP